MSKLPVLDLKNIKVQLESVEKKDAIVASGEMLVESGYVTTDYIDSMLKREETLSVYLGSYLAIPHGELAGKEFINQSGISVLIYPNGVDWNGEEVKVVIGIAGLGDDHMEILSNLAVIFSEEENIDTIVNATDPQVIYDLLV